MPVDHPDKPDCSTVPLCVQYACPGAIATAGFPGEIMLRLLKMLVLPLVAGSMIAGKHSTRSYLLQDNNLQLILFSRSCSCMDRVGRQANSTTQSTAVGHKDALLRASAVLGPKSSCVKC